MVCDIFRISHLILAACIPVSICRGAGESQLLAGPRHALMGLPCEGSGFGGSGFDFCGCVGRVGFNLLGSLGLIFDRILVGFGWGCSVFVCLIVLLSCFVVILLRLVRIAGLGVCIVILLCRVLLSVWCVGMCCWVLLLGLMVVYGCYFCYNKFHNV